MPVMVDLTDSIMWSKLLHKGSADQAPAVFTSTQNARRIGGCGNGGSGNGGSGIGGSGDGGKHAFTWHDSNIPYQYRSCGGSLTGQSRSIQSGGSSSVGESNISAFTARAPYEKDLFLVMSKPVLETLIVLWTNIAEDQLLGRFVLVHVKFPPLHTFYRFYAVYFLYRLLRGLWDFISICIDFKMDQMLSRLVLWLHILCLLSLFLFYIYIFFCISFAVWCSCCVYIADTSLKANAACLFVPTLVRMC